MPRLSAVGISGLQAGEGVKVSNAPDHVAVVISPNLHT